MNSDSLFNLNIAENILEKTRVYLSGPMDFVGSRVIEKYLGWRSIITPIFKTLSIRVLDPWNKPDIRGHENYGVEGVVPDKNYYSKDFWENNHTRAKYAEDFWETIHVDLRMTDLADYLIAFCPTNIYSVGTVHEIVVAREQHKPVLLVSPPVSYNLFPEINALSPEIKRKLKFYGLKENPRGIPSQWHGNIIGGQNIFDGFGWENMSIKDPDFYPKLLDNIINITMPSDSATESEQQNWQRVKNWIKNCTPLQKMKGGVLDHVKFPSDYERELFEKELNSKSESNRKYFWYNKSYTPIRPMLFNFFLISSGYIPPKIRISSKIDAKGNVYPVSHTTSDDNWLLITPDT